jgi:DNA-binding NtrC family response regulator
MVSAANILIIDDERVVCSGCKQILTDKGYAVDICSNGEAGLKMVLDGQYDVVFLDMRLPDKDGMEILEKARNIKPDASIIAMTGYSTVRNAVEAMKLGAFDYIAKPFADDELVMAVEKVLEKKRLVEENVSLRKKLYERFGRDNIVGETPAIEKIFREIEKVAPTDTTVLIHGESGTGKELFAGSIHAHSNRATCQFIAEDCSTISPGLLESELFGHVKGAFTGAIQDKAGIFEIAEGGTLFLDDIANINMDIQVKLLRILETHEFKPVGASYFKKANARVIAATNKDLKTMVEEQTFREDLYYRLNVFPIYLPPLRERRSDIPKLAYHFLRHFCRKMGKRIEGFSDDALEILVNHDWPGNVRQLKNAIERIVILSDESNLDMFNILEHIQISYAPTGDSIPETVNELNMVRKHLLEETFGHIQKAFLIKALNACNGNISRAAERVGMQRPNFHALMRKYNIPARNR